MWPVFADNGRILPIECREGGEHGREANKEAIRFKI